MEKGIVVPNNGGKLTSWVDYDSSLKTVEIRLSKFGESRPYDPLLAYPIDLSSKCEGREVFVGLSSGNSKSSEWSRVFSWRFGLRNVPKWMHSMPVDPRRPSLKQDEEGSQKNHLRPLTIVAGLIFATGCGALMAFLVLFVWAIAGNRNAIFVAEPKSVDFQYEKVSLVVEEGSKDDSVRG
ncbi:L-type lectin-domain containing receptor kinase S.4, partial [Cucurbita argyrosperma subsp. sororia]